MSRVTTITARVAYKWDIYNQRSVSVMANTGTALDGCILGFDGGPVPHDQMIDDSITELNARREGLGLPLVVLL